MVSEQEDRSSWLRAEVPDCAWGGASVAGVVVVGAGQRSMPIRASFSLRVRSERPLIWTKSALETVISMSVEAGGC